MPTYEVDVGGATYEVDAPDELTAWKWAKATHTQPPAAPQPGWADVERYAKGAVGSLQNRALGQPIIEGLASIAGGAAGAPLGPLGAVAGAGLGYGAAKQGFKTYDVWSGQTPAASPGAAAYDAARDVAIGATTEAAGRGIIGPAVGAVAKYANQLRNIKLDQYWKAAGGKADEIINALRGKTEITPGTSVSAGEAAAPAGSVGFTKLQEDVRRFAPEEYAAKEAQTLAARQQQAARDAERLAAAAQKVGDKIDQGMVTVSPRESGKALIDIADAERDIVKRTVVKPAYDAAFQAAGNAKIDVSNVIAQAESILGRKLSDFAPETAPSTVRKLLSFRPPPQKRQLDPLLAPKEKELPVATLQQLDDVRKAINADIAAAKTSAQPMADAELRNLMQLHSAIDTAVKQSKTLSDDAKVLYQTALDKYRSVFAPRFKTGVNANLFRTTSLNETKMNPDDVISRYFQPKGEREAEQFVAMFGKSPDAMKISRAGIEDLYRREVVTPAGDVPFAAHAKFMKKYADPIRILDSAGMGLAQRFDVVGKDAARLAKIQQIADKYKVDLPEPLPAGATADAAQKRIADATKNLSPQELSHIDAVQKDLLREGEYKRLLESATGTVSGVDRMGSLAGEKAGMPLPQFLSWTVTAFNHAYRKLALKLNDKLAMEIAREMTNPELAARQLEMAAALQRQRLIPSTAAGIGQATPLALVTGGNSLLYRNNALSQQDNQNKLRPQ